VQNLQDDPVSVLVALGQRATARLESDRMTVRAAAPEFFAMLDRVFGPDARARGLRLTALITSDGREFGKVTDDMREPAP
jgi:hypothetical protein